MFSSQRPWPLDHEAGQWICKSVHFSACAYFFWVKMFINARIWKCFGTSITGWQVQFLYCTVRNLWHCFWQRSSWGWQVGGDLRQNPYPCPKPINSERVTPPVTLLCRRNQINHNGTQLDWRHAELWVKIFPKFTHFSDYLWGAWGWDGVCWGTRNDHRDTRNF